mmetsp:Transcript_5923/g.12153  ORF Transcript_5923/g.12153 Transcript_5923/m.12153 type:complete len:89 (-) Transcript_5923:222-488(-)|eukprot:scaffold34640_cov143-Amphora_coffeaeformis.AAC.2
MPNEGRNVPTDSTTLFARIAALASTKPRWRAVPSIRSVASIVSNLTEDEAARVGLNDVFRPIGDLAETSLQQRDDVEVVVKILANETR